MSARGTRPHRLVGAKGAAGSGSGSPLIKSARSPGGTRTVDVTMTAGLGGGGGDGPSAEEARRLAQWRAQLAAESSDGDDGGAGAGKEADSGDEADAVLSKFGLGPQPAEEEFKGDFNWDGFKQVHTITEQNQELMRQLGEKDAEIERLQDVIVATEPIPGLDPDRLLDIRVGTEMIDADARDIKIMELAKRVRSINLQLQREKARAAGLEAERDKFKDVAESKVYPTRLKSATSSGSSEAQATAEALHAEKQKSRMLSGRLNEYRVKADRFETEMKKARAALRREVGGHVNIEEIVDEGTNWRGRAQKIVMLKSKVKELQEQVREHSTKADVDYKAKAEIQAMERERVRAVDGLTEEFERVQQQAVVYKRKMEAAKARTAVLERDNKKARESIATLLKKTSTDDELIEALRREVTEGRRRQGELTNELGSTRADLARTTSMKGAKVLTADEYERLTRQNKERGRQLEHQEKILTSLRAELRAARRSNNSNNAGSGGGGSGAPRPPRPSSAEARGQARLQSEFNEANLKMLQLDNAKQTELVNLLKRKLHDAEANAETAIARASELDQLCAEYEAQMGRQRNGLPARTGRKATAKTTAALQAQIANMQAEADALRSTFRTSLKAREDEIAMMRDQMTRMERQFSTQLERFRSAASAGSAFGGGVDGSGGASGSDETDRLREDNEILRRELTDVRAKYQQLNVRARNSGSGEASHARGAPGGGGSYSQNHRQQAGSRGSRRR